MSVGHPGDREIQTTRELLRALSSARQVYALYPSSHPKRIDSAVDLRDLALRLREESIGDPVVFVSGGNFYLGPVLLAWESLTLYRLAETMAEAGVQSVELLPGPTQEDMDGLVRLIVGESTSTQLGAVAVNRAGPATAADAIASGLAELLRSYAVGLDLLRETAARLLAGRPADLDATVRLTGHLADLISTDPAQALLLTTVKSYDEYTFHHMINVCILVLALGRAIGLSRDEAIALGIGGLLHDVGKVRVPQEILTHDGALDEEQWRLIQRHPVDGAGLVLITSRNAYHPAVSMVLEHHAAFDGSGYPTLSGRRVPALASRIVAVADCFDAMTSKRSYRKPEERRQALNLLQAGAGRAFDPRVVRTFVRLMGVFPVGSLVQLASGEVGAVVRNHERYLARPTIRLLIDARGNQCEPEELDLAEQDRDGTFRWSVRRSIDPVEVGIDMLSLLASGRLDVPEPEETGPGLVHEPAPSEEPPAGYVEAHADHALEIEDLPVDEDATPPPED
jgi:HD-GYP domain-containing protein (c-di-GMP phosphodiesterase class II)